MARRKTSPPEPAPAVAAPPAGKRGRRTDKTIEATLRSSYGLVATAARRLGMSRTNLYKRISKSERLQAALEDAREEIVDTGELKLIQAVGKGEAWAIAFVLKTLGKSRGFVERKELDDLRKADLSKLTTEELREWLASTQR